MFDVRCALSVVCCALCVVCCLLFGVACVLLVVRCFWFRYFGLLVFVDDLRFMFGVVCLTFVD